MLKPIVPQPKPPTPAEQQAKRALAQSARTHASKLAQPVRG